MQNQSLVINTQAGAKRLVELYMAGKLPMKKNWGGKLNHDLAGVLGVVK